MPFLADIEVHIRFLLVLPLLILAELVVHQRMRPVVRQFLADNNPAALAEIAARFAEALERGLWSPRSNSAWGELKQMRKEPVS